MIRTADQLETVRFQNDQGVEFTVSLNESGGLVVRLVSDGYREILVRPEANNMITVIPTNLDANTLTMPRQKIAS